jgi:hypothetical protein
LLLGLALLFFVAESRGTPPAPTPTITPTPTFTPSHSPTPTRYPTYTPYPTFTPIYTYTPYPTSTPLPPNLTYTPYPTFTPVPPEWTYTPYPTYTPFPPVATFTPLATFTPFPTIIFGLNGTPFVANLKISPNAGDGTIREQLRPQIQQCFARFEGVAKAGVALILGTNPSPSVGNRFARLADETLRQQYPGIFEETFSKQFHFISGNPAQNGDIEVEVYFITQSGQDDPFTPADAVCNP